MESSHVEPDPDAALLEALQRLRRTGPEFDGFLANHGPMAADALVRIGGRAAVEGWVDGYLPRLEPAPRVVQRMDAADWPAHLGAIRLLGDWTAYMREQALETSWRMLLLCWWPRLLPGLAASATHGVIRTAHAVRSLEAAGDNPHPLLVDELAQGLAYWAARFQTVPGALGGAGDLAAVPAVAGLPRLDPDVPSQGPGLSGRIGATHRIDGLPAALSRWDVPATPDAALDELVGAAARVLAARPDAPIAFCHAVTAPAAVRLVLPLLPVALQERTVQLTWHVVGSLIAAFGSPRSAAETDAADAAPGPLLDRLDEQAIAHGDEHVIKLTEAAEREYRRSGDVTLLVAADRFRGRIAGA